MFSDPQGKIPFRLAYVSLLTQRTSVLIYNIRDEAGRDIVFIGKERLDGIRICEYKLKGDIRKVLFKQLTSSFPNDKA